MLVQALHSTVNVYSLRASYVSKNKYPVNNGVSGGFLERFMYKTAWPVLPTKRLLVFDTYIKISKEWSPKNCLILIVLQKDYQSKNR